MDALAMIEAGYSNSVSVPNGAVMKVAENSTLIQKKIINSSSYGMLKIN